MRFKLRSLLLLFILPFFYSCVSDADFNQIDIDAEPRLNVPLVFFELNQLDFIDSVNNVDLEFVTDFTDVEVFQSSIVRDNLIRLDLRYEIEKNFSRGFSFDIEYLDDSGNTTYDLDPFTIDPNSDSIEVTQVIDALANPGIFNTTQIRITIGITPSATPLDPNVEETLGFKSAGIFYLRL